MTTSPGAYQGIEIIPGTDAEVQAQIKSIDASKGGTPTGSIPIQDPKMQEFVNQMKNSPSTVINTSTGTTSAPVSTEDQKLLNLGITPEQLQKIKTSEGLDPTSFQNLIGNVEEKLKTNNDLVTTRGYLIKQLYDSPLTPDQLAKLPPEIKSVVASGDKDTIELQLRLLNDQIAGRANTLSKSISYLADSYKTNLENAERERATAITTVMDFIGKYGSKAPGVLASLYGPTYLSKLKDMGVDIEKLSTTKTLAEEEGNGLGLTPFQVTQIKNQLSDNARQDLNIKDFSAVRSSYELARSAAASDNSAGDIVLMRMLAKITDPTTGVREEEFKTFEGAQGILAKYGMTLTKSMWGKGRLNEFGRTSLLQQVEDVYNQREAAYKNSVQYWDDQAASYGLGSPIPTYLAPEIGDDNSDLSSMSDEELQKIANGE